MIQSEVPKTRIDHFFKEDLLFPASDEDRQSKISFKSGHTLYKQTAKMVQDPPWLSGEVQRRPPGDIYWEKTGSYLIRGI